MTDWARLVSVLHAGICYGGPAIILDRTTELPSYGRLVDRFVEDAYHLKSRRRRERYYRRFGVPLGDKVAEVTGTWTP
jgi:hypothetical protein